MALSGLGILKKAKNKKINNKNKFGFLPNRIMLNFVYKFIAIPNHVLL